MFENPTQYILVAILVGLALALANYLLGFSKEQRQRRRRNAKLEFRTTFETDLHRILKSGEDARVIPQGKEGVYEEARRTLRKHLYFWQLHSFDKAWDEFFYHPGNKAIPFLVQYMDFGSLTKRPSCRALLNSRIGSLLAYAKVQP